MLSSVVPAQCRSGRFGAPLAPAGSVRSCVARPLEVGGFESGAAGPNPYISAVSSRQISVVVPVYDEHENIAECLRRLERALDGHAHEILVCYDRDEDTTLPAIAAMPDRPASVRLVRNDLGRGAANAIRAGFEAARGDVVVTTMADLSDPPDVIPKMAELLRREELAVVAGSRYMRGGSQTGGPLLKRTLSRVAGVSLDLLAHVGTKDATSNFRAYSAEFLRATKIESRGGFEIALELTTKAHLAGLRVGEVPSSWIDRSAGTSRFRLWKWLPSYLGWWIRAAWQPALVFLAWVALSVFAGVFVARSTGEIPLHRDLHLAAQLASDAPSQFQGLADLGTQRGELLPRLVQRALWSFTHDLRAAQFAIVALLAAAAGVLVLAARRARGRTLLADALFPVLLLNVGHSGVLLSASALGTALVVALAAVLFAISATRTGTRSVARAFVAAGALGGLLASGSTGVAFLPIALLAAFVLGIGAVREPASRVAGRIVLVAAAVVALLVYLGGVRVIDTVRVLRWIDTERVLLALQRFAAAAFGPAAEDKWALIGALVLGLAALTGLALVLRCVFRPDERGRAVALGACVVSSAWVALTLAIEATRAGDVEIAGSSRAALLATLLLAAIHLAWAPSRGVIARTAVPALLALGAATAFVSGNATHGARAGAIHREQADALAREIADATMPPQALVKRWAGVVHPSLEGFENDLASLARARATAFEHVSDARRAEFAGAAPKLDLEEDETSGASADPAPALAVISSPVEPARRRIGQSIDALMAPTGSRLGLRLVDRPRVLNGRFGVVPGYEKGKGADGVRFVIELETQGAPARTLFERTLDPVRNVDDRAPQWLDLELPANARGRLVFRIERPAGLAPKLDWGWWADVTAR